MSIVNLGKKSRMPHDFVPFKVSQCRLDMITLSYYVEKLQHDRVTELAIVAGSDMTPKERAPLLLALKPTAGRS